MNESLSLYLENFLHPIRSAKESYEQRVFSATRPLVIAPSDEEKIHDKNSPSFEETLTISWVFYICQAFYALIAIHIGIVFSNSIGLEFGEVGEKLGISINGLHEKVLLFGILLKVVLFPLSYWLVCRFWMFIIKFFGELFGIDGNVENISEEIVNSSMSSNILLIIPIFGEFFKWFFSIFYIFLGLRYNMRMSIIQGAIVLLAPIFVFSTVIVGVIVLYSAIIFSVLA